MENSDVINLQNMKMGERKTSSLIFIIADKLNINNEYFIVIVEFMSLNLYW